MEGVGGGYSIRYAPIADAREIEAAIDLLAELPQVGRRVRLRGQPSARRLLLHRTHITSTT